MRGWIDQALGTGETGPTRTAVEATGNTVAGYLEKQPEYLPVGPRGANLRTLKKLRGKIADLYPECVSRGQLR